MEAKFEPGGKRKGWMFLNDKIWVNSVKAIPLENIVRIEKRVGATTDGTIMIVVMIKNGMTKLYASASEEERLDAVLEYIDYFLVHGETPEDVEERKRAEEQRIAEERELEEQRRLEEEKRLEEERKREELAKRREQLKYEDASTYSYASRQDLQYVVLQVTLKEKFIGTGSANLTELEDIINRQAAKGYRLHTISTVNSSSKGLGGGDRIQATMVFEKIV